MSCESSRPWMISACLFLTCLLVPALCRADVAGGAAVAATAFPSLASPPPAGGEVLSARPWRIELSPRADGPAVPAPRLGFTIDAAVAQSQDVAAKRPVAFEYSDAYRVRAKIHKYASIATLPLFATEIVLGQKMYDYNVTDGVKSAHSAVAAGIGVLFGVNSVTGVWNLWEGWKDPSHRTKRLVHGILMLGADAGFVATGMTAPNFEEGTGNRSTHRAVALTSIGAATAGYLVMLLSR